MDESGTYDENGDATFEMQMPFLPVVSKGGPYDDAAFAAGWEAATVDAEPRLAAIVDPGKPIEVGICRTALAEQFDLMAMRHGYTVTVTASDDFPEWSSAAFTPAGP